MPNRKEMPLFFAGRPEEHSRILAAGINDLFKGRGNNTTAVTLTADSTTTVLTHKRYNADTVAIFMPKSASAALVLGKLYVVAATGTLTIHHDSTPDTDRKFGIAYVG